MRTRKLAVGTGQQEILYLHDGQNPIEEATFSNGPTRGAYTEIVRNGLGARGIDYVEVSKTGSATSVRFPVYDGHGNMTACLLRDGAGGFTLTSRRAYDPWGAMRQWGTHPSGASAYQGAPSNRYVGSLGHQQDDDSGLYYMRARYYEPGSGRFISEDPARHDGNWFAYCGNDPVSRADVTGKCWDVLIAGVMAFLTTCAILGPGGRLDAKGFQTAIVNAISSAAISACSNAIGKAAFGAGLSSMLGSVLKVSAGAAINVAANFLIAIITGDDEFGMADVLIAAFSGGVAGGIGGNVGVVDDAFLGSLNTSLSAAAGGAVDFMGS